MNGRPTGYFRLAFRARLDDFYSPISFMLCSAFRSSARSVKVAEPVLGCEVRPSLLDLQGIAGRGRREFFEEGLKPGRGYQLNCSGQLVGGIPERVSDTTRLDQIASWAASNSSSATRTPIVPAARYVYSARREENIGTISHARGGRTARAASAAV